MVTTDQRLDPASVHPSAGCRVYGRERVESARDRLDVTRMKRFSLLGSINHDAAGVTGRQMPASSRVRCSGSS